MTNDTAGNVLPYATANGPWELGIAIRWGAGGAARIRSFLHRQSHLTLDLMISSAIPVLAVSNSARSEDYYCRVLGFQKQFAYRPDPSMSDPCYLGVARDGVWLHLQSFKRERAGMTDAFLWVADVDLLHDEISVRGAVVQLPPTNQTWGNREIGIRDPDGNVLVFANQSPDTTSGKPEATPARRP